MHGQKGGMVLRVLSIDPGRTTGYALSALDKETFYIAYGQADLDHNTFWGFLKKTNTHQVIHTVCEDFEYRKGKQQEGLDLYPVELIGVLRLFCSNDRWYPLWMQKAAQGKGYYDDTKLRGMKLYHKGLEHGRDAARHLLHWFNFGYGYQFNDDPSYELVEEEWLRAKYF